MRKAVVIALVITGLVLAGCANAPGETGWLAGQVTIGPLSPVVREGETTVVPPEVYAARKVMVYDKSGKKLVRQVDLADDGTYRVELEVGSYTVDINRIGIDYSADVPRQVAITAGETLRLDIDIDTGIR